MPQNQHYAYDGTQVYQEHVFPQGQLQLQTHTRMNRVNIQYDSPDRIVDTEYNRLVRQQQRELRNHETPQHEVNEMQNRVINYQNLQLEHQQKEIQLLHQQHADLQRQIRHQNEAEQRDTMQPAARDDAKPQGILWRAKDAKNPDVLPEYILRSDEGNEISKWNEDEYRATEREAIFKVAGSHRKSSGGKISEEEIKKFKKDTVEKKPGDIVKYLFGLISFENDWAKGIDETVQKNLQDASLYTCDRSNTFYEETQLRTVMQDGSVLLVRAQPEIQIAFVAFPYLDPSNNVQIDYPRYKRNDGMIDIDKLVKAYGETMMRLMQNAHSNRVAYIVIPPLLFNLNNLLLERDEGDTDKNAEKRKLDRSKQEIRIRILRAMLVEILKPKYHDIMVSIFAQRKSSEEEENRKTMKYDEMFYQDLAAAISGKYNEKDAETWKELQTYLKKSSDDKRLVILLNYKDPIGTIELTAKNLKTRSQSSTSNTRNKVLVIASADRTNLASLHGGRNYRDLYEIKSKNGWEPGRFYQNFVVDQFITRYPDVLAQLWILTGNVHANSRPKGDLKERVRYFKGQVEEQCLK